MDAGLFRRDTLERLFTQHVTGRVDHNYRLWMVFNLEVFWRLYIDGASPDRLTEWIDRIRHEAAAEPPSQSVLRSL